MLNKVFSMKVDPLWQSWLAMLAKESGRGQGELLRDLIYFLVITASGEDILKLLVSEEVHYGR